MSTDTNSSGANTGRSNQGGNANNGSSTSNAQAREQSSYHGNNQRYNHTSNNTSYRPDHRGNGNGNSRPNSRGSEQKRGSESKPKFTGATEELNGHVFQCTSEMNNKNQYARTVEELVRYARKELTYGLDISYLLRNEEDPTFKEPEDPASGASQAAIIKWKFEMEAMYKRKEQFEENQGIMYAIILGQCSLHMENELKSNKDFIEIDKSQKDCVQLLNIIQSIIYKYNSKVHPYISILETKISLLTIKQQPTESVNEYKERFDTAYKALEFHGGSVSSDLGLLTYELVTVGEQSNILMKKKKTEEETLALEVASVCTKNRMKAFVFLHGADQHRFGLLLTELHNAYLHGIDQYPTNITKAFDLLLHYKRPKQHTNGNGNGKDHKKGKRHGERQSNGNGDNDTSSGNNSNLQGRNSRSEPSNTQGQSNFLLAHGSNDRGVYGSTPIDYGAIDDSGLGFLQIECDFLFQLAKAANIPISWVLLDSESTVTIIWDGCLLINICKIPADQQPLLLHTNGGVQKTDMVGDLPGYGTVWYNPKSLANVLSLAHVRRLYRVTYDSDVKAAFKVYKDDGSIIEFNEYKNGLYYFDVNGYKSEEQTTDYSFIEMVSNNKKHFTPRECKQAELARKVLTLTGRQNQDKMIKYLQQGCLKNAPITHEDMQRAKYIYGHAVPSLKGDTVRKQPIRVGNFIPSPLPSYMMDLHKNVTLCVDVVYIHKLPFLHSISRGIMFRTQQSLEDRHHWTVLNGIKMIINLYENRGFKVTTIFADNEFRGLQQDLPDITINACAADEHVPEIERSNRALKQRIRSTTHALPFRYYPKTLINGIVLHACSWLNAFPNENSVCPTMSPREVVTGRQTDFNVDCRVEIGSFCQITEHNTPTNSLDARTRDAIALHPTGNRQGSYFFMALDTWERVVRNQWKALPMPETIIQVVNERGRREGRRAVKKVNTFSYEWRPRKAMFLDDDDDTVDDPTVDDDDHGDDDYVPTDGITDDTSNQDEASISSDQEDDASSTSDDGSIASQQEHSTRDPTSSTVAPPATDAHTPINTPTEAPSQPSSHVPSTPPTDIPTTPSDSRSSSTVPPTSSAAPLEHHSGLPTFNPDKLFTRHGYNLRRRDNAVSYSMVQGSHQHSFLQVTSNPTYDNQKLVVNNILDCLFTQAKNIAAGGYDRAAPDPLNNTEQLPCSPPPSIGFSDVPYKKGIDIFGVDAVKAIIKEIAQLDDKSVFHAIDAGSLSFDQKWAALRALTFVKQKRCGKIKARTCADGRGQRSFYDKAESASPTVSIEGLLLTLAIDAIEGRDVATADIAGAYLNADMDDFVILKFDGAMVDFVVENNDSYKQFITYEKGKKVLYMQLDKALYGCLKSAILWYNMLSTFLIDEGFKINPYDLCVANKNINGKQCTICWYVDDLKISHVDSKVVDEVIQMIEGKFTKMNVVRGKKHVYVGCNIEFLENGEVSIDNIDYLKECVEQFGEDVTSHVNTPATRHLMTPKLGSKRLSKEKSETFQSITMKLLWIAKRSRPDLETALSFLCTRNHKSTEDDWNKLKRVLQFVNKTINDKRIISASSLGQLSMWIDASYAVHEDMRSHTGSAVSIGKGTVYCSSSKQKINIKSSTEGELVGCSDKVPQGIWSKYFLEAQGYPVEQFNLGQDNTSAMLLEENGIMSAGQKSRHINIRYFFIKDRLKQDKITLVHCPTEIMLADYFTKPLQGQLFKRMHDVIMGYCSIDDLKLVEPKECVKNCEVFQPESDSEIAKVAEPVKEMSWSDVVRKATNRQQQKSKRRNQNNDGQSNLIVLR